MLRCDGFWEVKRVVVVVTIPMILFRISLILNFLLPSREKVPRKYYTAIRFVIRVRLVPTSIKWDRRNVHDDAA